MESALIGLLAFCGVIIAAMVAWVSRLNHRSRSNPLSGDCSGMPVECRMTLSSIDAHLNRVDAGYELLERKMDRQTEVLIQIRTLLERHDEH